MLELSIKMTEKIFLLKILDLNQKVNVRLKEKEKNLL